MLLFQLSLDQCKRNAHMRNPSYSDTGRRCGHGRAGRAATPAARHGHLLQSEQWQDGRQSVTINNHRDVQKYFSGQKIFHVPRTLADIQFRYSSDDFGGLDRDCDGQTLLETILKLWIVVKVKPKRKWNSVRDWSTTYCSYTSPPMVRISIAMIYWDSSQRGGQCHCRKNSWFSRRDTKVLRKESR